MKLEHILKNKNLNESIDLDYGEPPKRPKNAPAVFDEMPIWDQRLYVKLNSLKFTDRKTPKFRSKIKIKTYFSGHAHGGFYERGQVSKDGFVYSEYQFENWVTEHSILLREKSGSRSSDLYIWSRECGIQILSKAKNTKSFRDIIGTGETSFVDARNLNLVSLDGLPTHLTDCSLDNNKISSIDALPDGMIIENELDLSRCGLTDLKDIHKKVKKCKILSVGFNEIKSNILGVLLIDGLEVFDIVRYNSNEQDKMISDIINKHLENKDLLDCQEELIDAGLEEYAKL